MDWSLTWCVHWLGSPWRKQRARDLAGATRGDPQARLSEQAGLPAGVADHVLGRVGEEGLVPSAPGAERGREGAAVVADATVSARIGHERLVLVAEIGPVGHVDDEREPVGERHVERLGARIRIPGPLVERRRIHGRPAEAQSLEFQPLDAPFVDERKQPVLVLRPAAVDLVDQDRFRAPDRGGRLEVVYARPLVIGEGKPDEVVERDQARVVVPVLEAKGLGQAVEEVGLARSARSHEEERILGDEGGKDDGFNGFEPVDAEGRQVGVRHGSCWRSL